MRGVYEHPAGSKVFWIHWQHEGKRHREKVGTEGAANKLYQKRKSEARLGRKLPELRNTRAVSVSDLVDLALIYTTDHKDRRSYVTKAAIVREAFGKRAAAEVTPQEIDRWLSERKSSPATSNRYKSFLSLCYREGLSNGKVTVNPARLVRQRKEPSGRQRFLNRAEYAQLRQYIREHAPDREPEFVVSVFSGMRQGEQFTVTWGQVHFDRRTIELAETKNGSARTVRMSPEVVAALQSVKPTQARAKDAIWPGMTKPNAYGTRSWFPAAVEGAGLSNYTWHGNRHTFCSWLAMAGASLKEIQELAGHKTIAMSARYAHLSPNHTLSVLDRLGTSTATE